MCAKHLFVYQYFPRGEFLEPATLIFSHRHALTPVKTQHSTFICSQFSAKQCDVRGQMLQSFAYRLKYSIWLCTVPPHLKSHNALLINWGLVCHHCEAYDLGRFNTCTFWFSRITVWAGEHRRHAKRCRPKKGEGSHCSLNTYSCILHSHPKQHNIKLDAK